MYNSGEPGAQPGKGIKSQGLISSVILLVRYSWQVRNEVMNEIVKRGRGRAKGERDE